MSDLYAVVAESVGMVKIGRAKNAARRLGEMQVGSPVRLSILRVWEHCGHIETEVHQLLEDERSHGEWFRWQGVVRRFLDEAAKMPAMPTSNEVLRCARAAQTGRPYRRSAASAASARPEMKILNALFGARQPVFEPRIKLFGGKKQKRLTKQQIVDQAKEWVREMGIELEEDS